MPKTFQQELEEAYARLGKSPHLRRELERVHKDAVRDKYHAYARVNILRPDPWKHRVDFRV